jgi:uncharacterized protein (UPF0332 family)
MSTEIGNPGDLFSEHWLDKARDDLATARSDVEAGRSGNAVRSLYFACFHALGSLLWKEGIWNSTTRRSRSVHKSVRSILHRDLIRTGRLHAIWGEFYDEIYAGRKEMDYEPLAVYEKDQVEALLEQATDFVKAIESLIVR